MVLGSHQLGVGRCAAVAVPRTYGNPRVRTRAHATPGKLARKDTRVLVMAARMRAL